MIYSEGHGEEIDSDEEKGEVCRNELFGAPRGLEFVWTSDSDSMVLPDTLTRTLETFSDGTIGGASTALYIHNRNETIITKLGSGVYLNELYLA